MIRSITFQADDLDFIENLKNQKPELSELAEHLKGITAKLAADDTIDVELPDELIKQAVKAEDEWHDDSGIINHIAIQFHHNA
jgi:hypothetical protein